MNIDVNVEIPESLQRKLSAQTYNKLEQGILDKLASEIYNNIQLEGQGVSGGRTPTGGAPVFEGPSEKATYFPGALKGSHSVSKEGNARYIKSFVFYVKYVIAGHGSHTNPVTGDRWGPARPNPYHKRAVDKALKDNVIEDSVAKILVNL